MLIPTKDQVNSCIDDVIHGDWILNKCQISFIKFKSYNYHEKQIKNEITYIGNK